MLYEKFIRLVEDHAELLTRIWIKEVRNNPATKSYRKIPLDTLEERICEDYKQLGKWLLEDDPGYTKTAEHYMQIGSERAKEGLKQSEVIYAIILIRVVLWKYVINQGVINSTFDFFQALEFFQKVTAFFDKATYFVAIGFENVTKAERDKLRESGMIDKAVSSVTNWFIKDYQKDDELYR